MKKYNWMVLVGIGTVFLVNAVFGRYLVLPGYLSSLEAGRGTLEAVTQSVPLWKIFRYLVWAYSFKQSRNRTAAPRGVLSNAGRLPTKQLSRSKRKANITRIHPLPPFAGRSRRLCSRLSRASDQASDQSA